jgi:hypothetical protein
MIRLLRPEGAPLHIRVLLGLISRLKGLPPGDYRDWRGIRSWTLAAWERMLEARRSSRIRRPICATDSSRIRCWPRGQAPLDIPFGGLRHQRRNHKAQQQAKDRGVLEPGEAL